MPSATPSSLLYLWDRRTLFVGQLSESLELSQAAATLVLGLDQGFTLESAGRLLPCRSALLPAGSRVRLQAAHNRLLVWYLDPFGADFAALRGQMAAAEGGLCMGLAHKNHAAQAGSKGCGGHQKLAAGCFGWLCHGLSP